MNNEKDGAAESLKPSPGGALALIDRAWDTLWALRVYCVVVFVDLALLVRTGRGLLNWPGSGDSAWQLTGYAMASAAVFGIVMSIGFPLLGSALTWLLNLIPWERWTHYPATSKHRRLGQVRAHELKEAALRDENTFALARYEEEVCRREESRRWDLQLGNLVFAALLLSIADGLHPISGNPSGSLVKAIFDFLGENGAIVASFVVVIASLAILKAAWFPERRTVWIDYPHLHERLNQEEREREHAAELTRRQFEQEEAERRRQREEWLS